MLFTIGCAAGNPPGVAPVAAEFCCCRACMAAASIKWLIDIIIEAASLLDFASPFIGTVVDALVGTVVEVVGAFDGLG